MFVQVKGALWIEVGSPVRETWSGGKSTALKMHYANQWKRLTGSFAVAFLGKSVWESLGNYISDGKIGDDISDVKDRQAYRHIQAKYRNQKSNLITLLMKTDGVLLFQSSHINLWPIYFVINA